MRLAQPKACLLRGVSPNFTDCLRTRDLSIDLEGAEVQHAAYRQLMERLVEKVVILPPSSDHPDCCFIEDTAVVIHRHAVITRPGASSRRGEVKAVAKSLSKWCRVHQMEAPAALDGGDVMRIGDTLLTGLSERTNPKGAEFLQKVAKMEGVKVCTVPLQKGLHLKSACTLADDHTAVFNPELIDPRVFPSLDVEWLPVPEPMGANVLALGTGVIVSQDAPQTAKLLEKRGLHVHTVQVTEFHKGDGALTCLSIRIPAEETWCC